MKKILATLICLSFSLSAFATVPLHEQKTPLVYTGIYGGYTNINGAYKNDGQVAQGRFMLGVQLARYKSFTVGAEASLQSGNDMRLQSTPTIVAATGGLQTQATLKPFLDLLLAVKVPFSASYPVVGLLKGGIAFRQLQLNDRDSSRDSLRQINVELQAGLAYILTQQVMVSAFYQGIYSGNKAGIQVDSASNITILRIPTQQGVFLGLEYSME